MSCFKSYAVLVNEVEVQLDVDWILPNFRLSVVDFAETILRNNLETNFVHLWQVLE